MVSLLPCFACIMFGSQGSRLSLLPLVNTYSSSLLRRPPFRPDSCAGRWPLGWRWVHPRPECFLEYPLCMHLRCMCDAETEGLIYWMLITLQQPQVASRYCQVRTFSWLFAELNLTHTYGSAAATWGLLFSSRALECRHKWCFACVPNWKLRS